MKILNYCFSSLICISLIFGSGKVSAEALLDLPDMVQMLRKMKGKKLYKFVCDSLVSADKRSLGRARNYKGDLRIIVSYWFRTFSSVSVPKDFKTCRLITAPAKPPGESKLELILTREFKKVKWDNRVRYCAEILKMLKRDSLFSKVCNRHFFEGLGERLEEMRFAEVQKIIANHRAFLSSRWDKKKQFREMRIKSEFNESDEVLRLANKLLANTGEKDETNRLRIAYYTARAYLAKGDYSRALKALKKYDPPHPAIEYRLSVEFGLLELKLLMLQGKHSEIPKYIRKFKNYVLSVKKMGAMAELIRYWSSLLKNEPFVPDAKKLNGFKFSDQYIHSQKFEMCAMLMQPKVFPQNSAELKAECNKVFASSAKNFPQSPYTRFFNANLNSDSATRKNAVNQCQSKEWKFTFECKTIGLLSKRMTP